MPDLLYYESLQEAVQISKRAKLYFPVRLSNVSVGDYSYVGRYAHMHNVTIGKFCSIGPNGFFGWGIHPIHGISTSPMFYSTGNQNGFSISTSDKVVEKKPIVIGNDVFIGMNVTILDGVTIGDGAVIGAGAVVSKDIPSYAVAVGNPITILKYRFPDAVRNNLLKIRWWDWNEKDLNKIEEMFFDVDRFISEAMQLEHKNDKKAN